MNKSLAFKIILLVLLSLSIVIGYIGVNHYRTINYKRTIVYSTKNLYIHEISNLMFNLEMLHKYINNNQLAADETMQYFYLINMQHFQKMMVDPVLRRLLYEEDTKPFIFIYDRFDNPLKEKEHAMNYINSLSKPDSYAYFNNEEICDYIEQYIILLQMVNNHLISKDISSNKEINNIFIGLKNGYIDYVREFIHFLDEIDPDNANTYLSSIYSLPWVREIKLNAAGNIEKTSRLYELNLELANKSYYDASLGNVPDKKRIEEIIIEMRELREEILEENREFIENIWPDYEFKSR